MAPLNPVRDAENSYRQAGFNRQLRRARLMEFLIQHPNA